MDPVSAVANALGAIIPGLGIGSKSRQAETAAIAKAQIEIADEKAKSYTKYLVISGVLILLITVIFLTLRKK